MRIIKHLPWSNLTIAYRRMHKIVMLHCEIKSIWIFVTLIITQVINFTQKSDVSIEIIISQRPERYTNHHKLASLHLHRIANIPTNQKRELEEVKSREHPLVRKHRYFPKKRKTECKRKWKPVNFFTRKVVCDMFLLFFQFLIDLWCEMFVPLLAGAASLVVLVWIIVDI